MFNFCGHCGKELKKGFCKECGADFDISFVTPDDVLDAMLLRKDCVSEFIVSIGKAVMESPENAMEIMAAADSFISGLEPEDEVIYSLLEAVCNCYEDEDEEYYEEIEYDYDEEDDRVKLEDCICPGCPYINECGGDCFFEDEDFLNNEKED